jgi:hypothetical protein
VVGTKLTLFKPFREVLIMWLTLPSRKIFHSRFKNQFVLESIHAKIRFDFPAPDINPDRLQYFGFIERGQSHAFFPDCHPAGHPHTLSASSDTLAHLHHGDR